MAANSVSTYMWPGKVHLGFGALERLSREARGLQVKRAFLVSDAGVVAAGLQKQITDALYSAGIEWQANSATVANPDTKTVDAIADECSASEADFVIGLGGGSALDTAKALRL